MSPAAAPHSVDLPHGTVRFRERGSGPPVVLLHGLLMAGSLWDGVAAQLESRFRCIAPDLPLGAHTVPLRPDADMSPAGVAQLVSDLLSELSLEDVTLVGNDTGGAIAQLVATRHADRVGRLVLTNCDAYEHFLPTMFRYLQIAARIPGAADVAVQSMRLRPLRRTPLSFGWLAKRLDDDLLASWIEPALHDGGVRRDARNFLRAIDSSYTVEAARQLPAFGRPVLVAWAPEDRVFRFEWGERLAADIPGARLERIDDSLTLVAVDRPDRTAELIASCANGNGAPSP